MGRGPGGLTDLHAARSTRGAHHCREVPRKDDTTATFSLRLERAKWAEIFFRLMHGILNMGLAVSSCHGVCAQRWLGLLGSWFKQVGSWSLQDALCTSCSRRGDCQAGGNCT